MINRRQKEKGKRRMPNPLPPPELDLLGSSPRLSTEDPLLPNIGDLVQCICDTGSFYSQKHGVVESIKNLIQPDYTYIVIFHYLKGIRRIYLKKEDLKVVKRGYTLKVFLGTNVDVEAQRLLFVGEQYYVKIFDKVNNIKLKGQKDENSYLPL